MTIRNGQPGVPCRPCERIWGLFGVAAGLVLLYMGLDLLSGGSLSSVLSGAQRRAVTSEETSSYDESE